MTDYHCENCEFFEDKSTDKLIDGYCKKYNQSLNFYDWWEKCDNCVIETLKAENANLRERLDKAVELPVPRGAWGFCLRKVSMWDGFSKTLKWIITEEVFAEKDILRSELWFPHTEEGKEAAEARLRELQGGKE